MLPEVDETIDEASREVGIEKNEFVLSENFEDFGFESSDTIRNLQVLFLFILFLVALPIVILLLRAMFFWDSRCERGLIKVQGKIFWSTYIRFMLEAFLELCMTSLLRVEHLVFDSGSEIFLSVLSLFILALIALFLIGSFVYLQKNLGRLNK